jgi:uncharacterized SAM-binding protein YcdF (DUF218 family)
MLTLFVLAFALAKAVHCWSERDQRDRDWWLGLAAAVIGLGVGLWFLRGDLAAQKTLAYLAMPAGLIWLGLAALAVAAWRVERRRLALALGGAWFAFALAGNYWLGCWLLDLIERRVPSPVVEELAPFDAVFVLGGGTDATNDGQAEFGRAGDRVALATKLWHLRKATVLVASGSVSDELGNARDLASETAALWRGLGVPASAIVQQPGALITMTEIGGYQLLARERGWKRLGLVSSAWHLPRALATCRRLGLEVTPLPADHLGRGPGWSPMFLVPQGRGFDRVERACWEWLGMLIGR